MSKLEEKIITLLQKDGYRFRREKSYKDLNKGKYRFDFEVYVDGAPALVEIQGNQHYQRVQKFFHSRKEFLKQQERDRRKISYCIVHGIPLYVVPYWEVEKLNSAKEIFQEKYLAKSMWKNDIDWIDKKI